MLTWLRYIGEFAVQWHDGIIGMCRSMRWVVCQHEVLDACRHIQGAWVVSRLSVQFTRCASPSHKLDQSPTSSHDLVDNLSFKFDFVQLYIQPNHHYSFHRQLLLWLSCYPSFSLAFKISLMKHINATQVKINSHFIFYTNSVFYMPLVNLDTFLHANAKWGC